jgi:hypothetical protein
MAKVDTNIKVYIIIHNDINGYVECKPRRLLCTIFRNDKGEYIIYKSLGIF